MNKRPNALYIMADQFNVPLTAWNECDEKAHWRNKHPISEEMWRLFIEEKLEGPQNSCLNQVDLQKNCRL